jgi:competence protein ComEC
MGARGAVALAVALWAGLAYGERGGFALAFAALILGAAACFATVRAPRALAGLLLLLAFAALGVARGAARHERFAPGLAAVGRDPFMARLVACIDEPPRREGDAPAAVLRVLAASARLPLGARVRVRLPAGCAADWGDTVEVVARLAQAPPPRNPGGYDARATARAANVLAGGRAFTCTVRRTRAPAAWPMRLAMRVRRAGERALASSLSQRARELVAPLLFGDRGGMSTDTDSALRASGLVHLLALSGLHVAWLAGVARAMAALLRGGLLARAVAGAVCALGYALVAGPIPSLARAVVAEACTAIARATHRALDPLQSLALAVLALLTWQPGWGMDLGFQLSCVATLGLVAMGGSWSHEFARGPRLWRALAPALATTLGAQLAALPLLLARFHALPWTALSANLVAVPVSELLLAAAAIGTLLEALLPGAGGVWLAACEPLAALLHAITRLAGAWPGARIATGDSPWPVALAALGGAALVWGVLPGRELAARRQDDRVRHALALAGGTLTALAVVCALCARPLVPPPGAWWLVAIDVGQGDALALATREGWWLVDTGPRSAHWDAGESAVLPFLQWAGVRELRALVLTHDDGDHTGGALALRRGVRVRAWFGPAPRPGVPGPCARYAATPLARGDTLAVSPRVRVCWPPRVGEPGDEVARRGDNAASVVLEVGEGGERALLTADADSVVELQLVVAESPAVLKAGHHGSGSSTGAAFVLRLRPGRAIISCGAGNSYGHPHPGALARLGAAGVVADRTDHDGALWYEFRAGGMRRLDWRYGEPWRVRVRQPPACGPASAPRAP